MSSELLQHIVVIALALVVGSVLVVRRVRALRRGNACDGCAHSGACRGRVPTTRLRR